MKNKINKAEAAAVADEELAYMRSSSISSLLLYMCITNSIRYIHKYLKRTEFNSWNDVWKCYLQIGWIASAREQKREGEREKWSNNLDGTIGLSIDFKFIEETF